MQSGDCSRLESSSANPSIKQTNKKNECSESEPNRAPTTYRSQCAGHNHKSLDTQSGRTWDNTQEKPEDKGRAPQRAHSGGKISQKHHPEKKVRHREPVFPGPLLRGIPEETLKEMIQAWMGNCRKT